MGSVFNRSVRRLIGACMKLPGLSWRVGRSGLYADVVDELPTGPARRSMLLCSAPASAHRAALLEFLESCSPVNLRPVVEDALRYQALRGGIVEDERGNLVQAFAHGSRLALSPDELDALCDHCKDAELDQLYGEAIPKLRARFDKLT